MRHSSWILAAALAIGSLSLNGCLQTCNQLCVENARYIDGCLETWEAMWPDFGFDGKRESEGAGGEAIGSQYEGGPAAEYVERCQARYVAANSLSSPDDARTVREGCADDLQLLAASVSCADYAPNDSELDPTKD
jgi:hypothetical protein